MMKTISKKIAPTGELRVGLNMSNFLLINSKGFKWIARWCIS
jgi:hypothetical protein